MGVCDQCLIWAVIWGVFAILIANSKVPGTALRKTRGSILFVLSMPSHADPWCPGGVGPRCPCVGAGMPYPMVSWKAANFTFSPLYGDCNDDDSAWLRRMESGIVLANGYAAKAESCRVLDAASARTIGCEAFAGLLAEGQGGSDAGHRLVEVVMRQGAKREVRRLLKAAGYRTLRLCRVAVGNVAIDGLHSGEVREVSRDQLLGLYASAFRDHSSSVMDLPTFDAPTGGWVRASELAAIGSERRELVGRL